MQEVYWGEYKVDDDDIMQPVIPDQLVAPQKVKEISSKSLVGVGDGWEVYSDILAKRCKISLIKSEVYPQAKYIAQLAVIDFDKGMAVSAEEALPTYLREEVAWVQKK
jgi:tRNA threonylcarbamoyladenosine biosynthesis protein TsaB